MSDQGIVLPSKGKNRDQQLIAFGQQIMNFQRRVGFKISARGWCYQLEGFRLINKNQFDRVESLINELRQRGGLPIDFVAEEEGREFSGVENPTSVSPVAYMKRYLNAALDCDDYYTPDWWDGEEYYIQMIVEKIDLKTLFEPVCHEYHIPIATAKGWSSMLMRAKYGQRFKEAEAKGLKCVLLYCGDHDPDGLRISEFLRNNLRDLAVIRWNNGDRGYDPANLIINRFGLNYDFIESNDLTWIDNLITGSGKDLSSPSHPNHTMPYVQEYLSTVGVRKCEANALVVRPEESRDMCREAIEEYLGRDALDRFSEKMQAVKDIASEFRERTGLEDAINKAIEIIDKEEEGKERGE